MNEYTFQVTVKCETPEEATQVMWERIGPDEDYGFEYRIWFNEIEGVSE